MNGTNIMRERQNYIRAIFDMVILLPWTLIDANIRCGRLANEFSVIIDPLIYEFTECDSERGWLRVRLLPAAIKGAFLMQNYAKMAEKHLDQKLGLKAGVFTRLYDDLIDGSPENTFLHKTRQLFDGGDFEPSNQFEHLFLVLFQSIENELPSSTYQICYNALLEVHNYQFQSRKQTTQKISATELKRITTFKGAKGTLVLLSMVKDDMSEKEILIVEELGSCFQHIDDYEDYPDDLRRGVSTLATRGMINFIQLARWISELAILLEYTYGRQKTRIFIVGLYYWLLMAFFSRILNKLKLKRSSDYRTKDKISYILPIQLLFS